MGSRKTNTVNEPLSLLSPRTLAPIVLSLRRLTLASIATVVIGMCSVPRSDSRDQSTSPSGEYGVEQVRSMLQREAGDVFRLNGEAVGRKFAPLYVTGDFNGDGHVDVAGLVSVHTESLVERLTENPRWSIPGLVITKTPTEQTNSRWIKEARLSLWKLAKEYPAEVLLLIIHGPPGSTPHLKVALLDFSNYGELKMSVSRTALRGSTVGDGPEIRPPRFKGDTIRLLDVRGEGTAVYWNERRYLWYPVVR